MKCKTCSHWVDCVVLIEACGKLAQPSSMAVRSYWISAEFRTRCPICHFIICTYVTYSPKQKLTNTCTHMHTGAWVWDVLSTDLQVNRGQLLWQAGRLLCNYQWEEIDSRRQLHPLVHPHPIPSNSLTSRILHGNMVYLKQKPLRCEGFKEAYCVHQGGLVFKKVILEMLTLLRFSLCSRPQRRKPTFFECAGLTCQYANLRSPVSQTCISNKNRAYLVDADFQMKTGKICQVRYIGLVRASRWSSCFCPYFAPSWPNTHDLILIH